MSVRVTVIHPPCAIEGGRITIEGTGFPVDGPSLPEVRIGDQPARLVYASSTQLAAIVPAGLEGGRTPVRVAGASDETWLSVDIAGALATGLHQVDNPIFDRDDNLYVTYRATRGKQGRVSFFPSCRRAAGAA